MLKPPKPIFSAQKLFFKFMDACLAAQTYFFTQKAIFQGPQMPSDMGGLSDPENLFFE